MKKFKLALLGNGYLNELVANALAEHLPEFELVGVMGRSLEKTEDFAKRHHCKPCYSIEELMTLKPDFTAEAASVQSIKDYAKDILQGGSNLVVLSIGAFADANFYEEVKNTARQSDKKVYIASGAVGGFDVLRTAALMSPITASITSKKMPTALKRTPLYKEGLEEITQREEVFYGSTKEAIAILPTHVNVAIATALASAGPEKTVMKMDAVPGFVGDEYKIEIKGEQVSTDLNIYSRTSEIAAWSVVAVLQNCVSPIVF